MAKSTVSVKTGDEVFKPVKLEISITFNTKQDLRDFRAELREGLFDEDNQVEYSNVAYDMLEQLREELL